MLVGDLLYYLSEMVRIGSLSSGSFVYIDDPRDSDIGFCFLADSAYIDSYGDLRIRSSDASSPSSSRKEVVGCQ